MVSPKKDKKIKKFWRDRAETILGIQQGFDEVNAGKTRPLGDFVREMEQKYEISG